MILSKRQNIQTASEYDQNQEQDSFATVHELAASRPHVPRILVALQYKDRKIGCSAFIYDLRKLVCFTDTTVTGFDVSADFKTVYSKRM